MKTYYEILEVRDDASAEVIEMAYKALMKKYHPDVYHGDPDFAHDITQTINEAHKLLSDSALRLEYDRTLVPPDEPATGKLPMDGSKIRLLLVLVATVLLVGFLVVLFLNQNVKQELASLQKQQTKTLQSLENTEKLLISQKSEYDKLLTHSSEQSDYLSEYYSRACFTVNNNDYYHRFGCPKLAAKTLTILDIKNAKRLGYRPCSECWDKTPSDFF